MANKDRKEDTRQKNLQLKNERQFEAMCRKLVPYPRVAAVILAVTLLLFSAAWADVYNSDIGGVEVSINGLACAASAVTGNYTSADTIYKDMAVPFYYYAAEYCQSLARFTLIAAVAVVISFVLQIAAVIVRKAYALNIAATALNVIASIFLIVCFSVSLSMADSDIIPIYCGGNPACSIRSFAVIPAIFTLGAAAVNLIASIKYIQARRILE